MLRHSHARRVPWSILIEEDPASDTSKHSVWWSLSVFPYQCVDSLEKLKFESLPPQESFYSLLKQECISDEDYEFCQCMWVKEGVRAMCDFLGLYNNCDVKPFLKAIEAQVEIY